MSGPKVDIAEVRHQELMKLEAAREDDVISFRRENNKNNFTYTNITMSE